MLSGKEAYKLLEDGKRALELAALDKPQSAVNMNNAQAISVLAPALGNQGHALIGNLLVDGATDENGEIVTICRELPKNRYWKNNISDL